jgi:aspartate aminotransferase-like enzyme
MEAKEFLMIPGPTPVPDEILAAMARHPLAHRSKEFSKILTSVTASLKKLAMAEDDDAFILTSSGTGAMEAAIANTLSPGDQVICLVCGMFGERWAKICEAFGLKVERLKSEAGQPLSLEKLGERLLEDKGRQIKAVTLTHNETSTGVLNDLQQLVLAVREHGAISIVDAVTSFGAVPISFSDWGIDVLVTGSQKALMLPPGLSCIFLSERAWKAYEKSTMPKFYFDLGRFRTALSSETTPFTPNVSMVVALKASLEMIHQEGLKSIYARHEKIKKALRAGLVGMGLKPLVAEPYASPTITSVLPPVSISVDQIRRLMNERYQMKLADGQEELKNKIFRVGHMGYVFERDILMCLAALEVCLTTLGHRCPSGIGVGSAITELTSLNGLISK